MIIETMGMIFVIILIVLIVLLLFFRGTIKGKIGEEKVALILDTLPRSSYKTINNLLINQNGYSSQIDHVVISEYGIFVIETKNYKGWIYGGSNSEYWTQNIFGNKNKLRNPILQNQGHIRALNRLLKLDPKVYVSVVAFSRQAQLKSYFADCVVYISQVPRLIKSYNQKRLSLDTVEWVYKTLSESNSYSRQDRKQHIKNVKENIYKRNRAVSNGLCPQCGGTLILRNGKYGRFYGCSNYPNCTYTHPF